MARMIFISGGVRSGKSSFAESVAEKMANGNKPLNYIACGERVDDEMKARIAQHQYDRTVSQLPWNTIECPTNVGSVTEKIQPGAIVLLDCLTTLVANELFTNSEPLIEKIERELQSIADACSTLIIVSNEVGFEPFDSGLVKKYAETLGVLHQWIVEHASEAYLVETKIPKVMKSEVVG